MRAGVAIVLAGVALIAAVAASADTGSYALAPTKSCLTKKGASLQASTPGAPRPGLTNAQDAETLVGTISAGGVPDFLYLVVGRNATDAAAVMTVLRKSMTPAATSSDSWSGAQGNVAWTVLSLSGKPPASTHSLVLSCLKNGPAPGPKGSPTAYTPQGVSICLATRNQQPVEPGMLQETATVVFGKKIPAALVPHTLLALTATSPSVANGMGVVMVFGTSTDNAIALRTRLEQALGLRTPGDWQGARKNVAWYAYRLHKATAAGIAAGKTAVLACLP